MSDTVAKVLDSNIEAKRAASAQMAWGAPAAAGSIPEDGAAAGPVAAASSGAVAAATATLPALGTAAPAPVKVNEEREGDILLCLLPLSLP